VTRRGRGQLIACEGLDGSGKSTQLRLLAEWLRRSDVPCRVLRLYDNPLLAAQFHALNARRLIGAREASLMYAAEIAGRVAYVSNPLVAEGNVVLWDKYAMGGRVRDACRDLSDDLLDAVYSQFPAPDLLLYFDVTPDLALQRKQAHDGLTMWECGLDMFTDLSVAQIQRRLTAGAFDPEDVGRHFRRFQGLVRDGYERALRGVQHLRFDGTLAQGELFTQVREAVASYLWRAPGAERGPPAAVISTDRSGQSEGA
jgi:dTMP kinase